MRSSSAWAPNLKCGLRFPKFLTALAALSLLLAGCAAAPAASPTPTKPSSTTQPTAADIASTVTATEIADTDNYAISIADIYILSPGSGSQVSSPIDIDARLQAGADGHVIVELSDPAGRILVRQVLAASTAEFAMQLPFEVSRPPLPARLTLRTLDGYGRTQALNSVELMLLAEGQANIVPGSEQSHITLSQPADGQQISGEIVISGTAYTANNRPLSIQLITREGRVLVAREIYTQDELSRPAIFETVLTVKVNEPTWVQVAVSERGYNIPGTAHFSAVEVLLLP